MQTLRRLTLLFFRAHVYIGKGATEKGGAKALGIITSRADLHFPGLVSFSCTGTRTSVGDGGDGVLGRKIETLGSC